MRLILASSSAARAQVLGKLAIPFEQIPPDIDETPSSDESPQQLVKRLAIAKAYKVAKQYDNAFVIGADQVAMINNKPVGKPITVTRAIEQLLQVSGQRITFYSGICLIDTYSGKIQSCLESYTIHFKSFDRRMASAYVAKDHPLQCAGSFRSEGLGIALTERYEGADPNTIIGLPLIRLVAMFEACGINILLKS